jgi:hypothetical protein
MAAKRRDWGRINFIGFSPVYTSHYDYFALMSDKTKNQAHRNPTSE